MEDKREEREIVAVTHLDELPITASTIQSLDFAQKYEYLNLLIQKLNEVKKNVDSTIKEIVKDNYLSTGKSSLSSEGYKYTYVQGSTRETLDTKKIKAEYPEVYKNCLRITPTSDSVHTTRLIKDEEVVESDVIEVE